MFQLRSRRFLVFSFAVVAIVILVNLSKFLSSDLIQEQSQQQQQQSQQQSQNGVARSENSASSEETARAVLNRFPPGTWEKEECRCKQECLVQGDADARALGDISQWAPIALQRLMDSMFQPWEENRTITLPNGTQRTVFRGKINLYTLLSQVTCRFGNRYGSNPTGIWVHIAGHTCTLLRHMIDGYSRSIKILRYVRRIVAEYGPFEPMSMYISTTDIHCHPFLPYFSFFHNNNNNVHGLLIPDDTFVGTHVALNWSAQRTMFLNHSHFYPFQKRAKKVFFRGSPTHQLREELRAKLTSECCASRSDVKLAVLEKFKHLQVPLKEHVNYRYLLAVRGRSASSRDKYLNLLNSTILWGKDDDVVAKPKKQQSEEQTLLSDKDAESMEDPDLKDAVDSEENNDEGGETTTVLVDKKNDDEANNNDTESTTTTTSAAPIVTKKPRPSMPRPDFSQIYYTPYYQFYHVLWLPYVNFVPMRPSAAGCTLDLLDSNPEAAERIAKRGQEIGEWLTQERVDEFFVAVMKRYQRAQDMYVDRDPMQFLRACNSMAKRQFNKINDLLADHPYNRRWNFGSWLRRRIRQIESCRRDSNYDFNTTTKKKILKEKARFNVRANQNGCWYM